jgi:eukaryotic-like serine/threonine-protein kinase
MVGDVLGGRYELQELVGTGGMSSVFRAHDRVLERTVALKVLHQRLSDDEEYVERFRREARMVAGLSHQNIVTVIDRGEDGGRSFIVFEFVSGENLKQVIQREGPLPVERALELGVQIARGLAFAHSNGYVHRDVKPQNVLLNGDGQAKVTDFGIARSLDVKHGVTQTGTVLGTSDYIAPEQAQGRQVDEHTDVYSLGIVLYELLTGEVPFTGDNFVAVAMRHINEPPPSVRLARPDVSPRTDAAIQRALAKDPDERYTTMADFGRELESCLEEARLGESGAPTMLLPAAPAPAPAHQPVRTRSRRRPLWPWLLLLVLGIACAALAYALVRHTGGGGNNGGSHHGTATGAVVALTGIGNYPPGSNDSHAGTASLATDGNPSTEWYTQRYDSPNFGGLLSGLGLLLDAGSSVPLAKITVVTSTPGFVARILAGDSPSGPLATDSATKTVGSSTTFTLSGKTARYYAVFITQLPSGDVARIGDVTATR